jgi:putative tryptophan/tyrosine transport system substrate-binding protein
MTKSILFWLLTTVLLRTVSPAEAQQPTKVHRIGYLSSVDLATDLPRAEGIRRALRELGYIEGQNIAFEFRHGEGKRDRASEFVAELLHLKVDIILIAGGEPWIWAAKNATKTIPIVMMGQGLDPVKEGLVESLGRPGGNVTGLTALTTELGGKRLELLKEAIPKLARVAVLYDPATGAAREANEILPAAVRPLGLTIKTWEVRAADDFDRVFSALSKDRPDGLYALLAGAVLRPNVKRMATFVLKNRLPSVYSNSEAVYAGGLMFYGADLLDNYRRAAMYVDKILKGAKPSELPVEQPTKFEFIINLKTAKQIGVTIPPSVLARADRVIR